MDEMKAFHWNRVNRISMLVREGAGGTLVIVPGAMADATEWLAVGNALSTALSVAIINRVGRAPSESMPRDSKVPDEVQDVRDALSSLQAPFHLIGWSYGGLLALEATVGRTDISSVVLYEPVCGPFAVDAMEPIWRAIDSDDLDRAVELVLTKVGHAPQQHADALRDTRAWGKLKTLVVPAAIELSAINNHRPAFSAFATGPASMTVIIGERNRNLGPYGTTASLVAANLPTAQTVWLPDQGHLAHLDQPVQLAKLLLEVVSNRS